MKNSSIFLAVVLLPSLLTACMGGPSSSASASDSDKLATIVAATLTALPPSTPIPNTTDDPAAAPVPASGPTSKWIEYRDTRYGYGFAVPCHWTIYPTPPEGYQATLSMMSYNDQFVLEHTHKGEWVNGRPQGAIKMDLVVFEDIDPSLSLEEAISQMLDSEFSSIVSTEKKMIGSHPAIIGTLASKDDPSNKSQVVAFRLSVDKLLIADAIPEEALASSDVQSILSSIAFSHEEKIGMPSIAPSTPLIPLPSSCK
jgi:hypothetical protein